MLGTPPQPCSSQGAMRFLSPYLPSATIPQDSRCFGPTVQHRQALMPQQLPGAHTGTVEVTTWCRCRWHGEGTAAAPPAETVPQLHPLKATPKSRIVLRG